MDEFPNLPDINQLKLEVFNNIPSLEDLEYQTDDFTSFFKGGEREGLKIMEKFLSNKKMAAEFEKPKTIPTSVKPDTTSLSPYLKYIYLIFLILGLDVFHQNFFIMNFKKF